MHLLGFKIPPLACKRLFQRFRLDWAIATTSAIHWQFVAAIMVIAVLSMKASNPWIRDMVLSRDVKCQGSAWDRYDNMRLFASTTHQ